MMKIYNILFVLVLVAFVSIDYTYAGNPDRQGEAGAYELLMMPWARAAGIHGMNTSSASGVEAMRINPAGIGRIQKTEIILSSAQYLVPTGITMNALGFTQKVGENGAFGVSLMSLDFGDLPVTTVNSPEGTGAEFSPSFFNLGLSYATTFDDKISVGALVRGVSESIADVNAFGFALDAGVQYVSGEKKNFKFGISLRNIGGRMDFGGEGLADIAVNDEDKQLRYNVIAANFEMPSMLNIGISYDFYVAEINRISAIGNFRAHSFSRDQVGGAVEYSFKEMFMLRAGYIYDLNQSTEDDGVSAYSGLSAGVSFDVPVKKESDTKLGIDYAYRSTDPFSGTHNFGLRITL